jgi:hypothetical protein
MVLTHQATILMSNSVPKEHQGIAASLVVTTVNYAISCALGLVGTVEVQVAASNPRDSLAGFRAVQYFSTGVGGLSVRLALCFLLHVHTGQRVLSDRAEGTWSA